MPGVTTREQAAWDAVQEHGSQKAASLATGISVSALQNSLLRYRKKMGISTGWPAPPTRNVILTSIDDHLAGIENEQKATTAMIAGLLDACLALSAEVAALNARPSVTHRRKADGGVGGKRERGGL
jgi:hypothetical protein